MTDETNHSGALSRRGLLKVGAYAAGAGAAAVFGVAATTAQAQVKKAAQKDAGYQEAPNAGKSCSNCRQFQAPSACSVVEGSISPNGYCRLYAKKG